MQSGQNICNNSTTSRKVVILPDLHFFIVLQVVDIASQARFVSQSMVVYLESFQKRNSNSEYRRIQKERTYFFRTDHSHVMSHHILTEILSSLKTQYCFSVHTVLSKLSEFFLVKTVRFVHAMIFEYTLRIQQKKIAKTWVFFCPQEVSFNSATSAAPNRSHNLLWEKAQLHSHISGKDNSLLMVRETLHR